VSRQFLKGVGMSLLLLTWLGAACYASPRIFVEEEVYDFGVVVEGETVSHAFLIENQGDETLQILRVWASCGCTTTNLSDPELEPGDVRRITVEVSTEGYGGSKISKSVHVESNDPEQPDLVLRITGTVVPEKAYLIDAADLAGSLMLLVDVRDPVAYAEGHLLGAVNLPYADADLWLEMLPREERIVLYDQDGEVSALLAERMLRLGYVMPQVLTGGLDEWIRRYGERMIVTIPLVIGVMGFE